MKVETVSKVFQAALSATFGLRDSVRKMACASNQDPKYHNGRAIRRETNR